VRFGTGGSVGFGMDFGRLCKCLDIQRSWCLSILILAILCWFIKILNLWLIGIRKMFGPFVGSICLDNL
jgi:hypothetical protein